ncbi:hypothetical protein [Streptomyces sp. NPDC088785]|uniref:hypothetical protein n=1 Tax=Streptomyces sp. NPDC088785 TaxID=3365897 RepID=UPI00380761D0
MNGDWLIRGREGGLRAYAPAPEGDAVVCRAERAPGGPWTAPRTVGGDQRVHPDTVALARSALGYTHLAAWRPTVPGESGLVHSTHYQPHLSALDWSAIGHPNKKGDRTGPPAVAVDAQGRAHVLVRNNGGGMSLRIQAEKGGWGAWRDLKGRGVRGRPAAVTGESGLITLYAATGDGLLRWRQPEPGAALVLDDAPRPAAVRPDSLCALATSAGHTTLFYVTEDGGLYAWRGDEEPVRLVEAAGDGAPVAVRCRLDDVDCTLLAQRSRGGRVAFAAYPTETESAGAWWTESGDVLPADARLALTEDARGRVVAAVLLPGAEPRLLLAHRKPDPALALTPWTPTF